MVVGDAKVTPANQGEHVEDALGRDAHGVKLLEDLGDGPSRARGIVKVLVEELGLGEFAETILVVAVAGKVGQILEERPPGHGVDVDVVQEQAADGTGRGDRVQRGWKKRADGEIERLVGDVVPVHERDDGLHILREVSGVDGETVARVDLRGSLVYIKGKQANVLPVGVRRHPSALPKSRPEASGQGELVQWWRCDGGQRSILPKTRRVCGGGGSGGRGDSVDGRCQGPFRGKHFIVTDGHSTTGVGKVPQQVLVQVICPPDKTPVDTTSRLVFFFFVNEPDEKERGGGERLR